VPSLGDNLRRWREAAELDWFSAFIKAWIPFNAWMSDTFGDITDREMLDRMKGEPNVVSNRIVPMLTYQREHRQWSDETSDASEFRTHLGELHRLLEACVVNGRRGRISFDSVDLGANTHRVETRMRRGRELCVERDAPERGHYRIALSATRTDRGFDFVVVEHNIQLLEDNPHFRRAPVEYTAQFREMFHEVAPRRVGSVIARHEIESVIIGRAQFVDDPSKIFAALVDVVYNLRNALFHGSITPNEQHNEIYRPAYHLVMRWVQCTL
jgi:hypothetical protein